MNNTKLRMTAQIPSGFGMPSCGHTSVVISVPTFGHIWLPVADKAVVRDAKAITGATGNAQATYRGTNAWRPLTS